MKIWFHADDFGITREQSDSILQCHTNGALNSISILANTEYIGQVNQLLQEQDEDKQIRRILHLNFVEGYPVANKEDVACLVDAQGMFCCTFIKLFVKDMLLFGKKRVMLKQQIKTEILAQLDTLTQNVDGITGIDSHQHYHMIPVVFEALCEAMDERPKLQISCVRVPVDPVIPFLTTPGVWKDFRVINMIKWCILHVHAGKIKKELEKRKIMYPVFFGIFFTCEMKENVVKALLPKYRKLAEKKQKDLELMFHPGALQKKEELLDPASQELIAFYLSENRTLEKMCLQSGIQ